MANPTMSSPHSQSHSRANSTDFTPPRLVGHSRTDSGDTFVGSPPMSPGFGGPSQSFHPVSLGYGPPRGSPRRVPVPVRENSAAHWGSRSPATSTSSYDKLGGPNKLSKPEPDAGRRSSSGGTWTFEIISLLVAVCAVGAIIGVLAAYEDRPLPSWPYSITINALIALLATIANASLALPLSSGLSQLKWVRFKTRRAPLSDMEMFDDASRGTLGAAHLLLKFRGG